MSFGSFYFDTVGNLAAYQIPAAARQASAESPISDDTRERVRHDLSEWVVDHPFTFAGVYGLHNKTYRSYFDEALRANYQDALALRRDTMVSGFLQNRQLPVVEIEYRVVPDNPEDPDQMKVARRAQRIYDSIPRMADYRSWLLEATYFGKSAVQSIFGKKHVDGEKVNTIVDHVPVNGDKIIWKWGARVPAILTNPTYRPASGVALDYDYSDRGPCLVLDHPVDRMQFGVHKFRPADMDYLFEGDLAGSVGGLGLRGRIYHAWWLRTEVLTWFLDGLQRIGSNGQRYGFYDEGNADDKAAVLAALRELNRNNLAAFPKRKGDVNTTIEHIAPTDVAFNVMLDIIKYFDDIIRRLILGQDLSTTTAPTGMGSGVADLHRDVLGTIIRTDAKSLAETETKEVLEPLIRINRWRWKGRETRHLPFGLKVEAVVDGDDAMQRLQLAQVFMGMGGRVDLEKLREEASLPAPKAPPPGLMPPGAPGAPPGDPNAPAGPGGPPGGEMPPGASQGPPGAMPAEGGAPPDPGALPPGMPQQYGSDRETVRYAATKPGRPWKAPLDDAEYGPDDAMSPPSPRGMAGGEQKKLPFDAGSPRFVAPRPGALGTELDDKHDPRFDGPGKAAKDIEGFSRRGLDRDRADRQGYYTDEDPVPGMYDRLGRDAHGFDRGGVSAEGIDRRGHHVPREDNRAGYDPGDYDIHGFDDEGFDRAGFDEDDRHRDDDESEPDDWNDGDDDDDGDAGYNIDEAADAIGEGLGVDVGHRDVLGASGLSPRWSVDAKVSSIHRYGDGGTSVTVESVVRDLGATVHRTFHTDPDGSHYIHNDLLKIAREERGQGAGMEILSNQVEHAVRMGFRHIECNAARMDDRGFFGYKVWPKFGYDAELPEHATRKLPPELAHCERLADLYGTPEGRAWWEANGHSIDVRFDLSAGSESLAVLDAYRASKGLPPIDQSRRRYQRDVDSAKIPRYETDDEGAGRCRTIRGGGRGDDHGRTRAGGATRENTPTSPTGSRRTPSGRPSGSGPTSPRPGARSAAGPDGRATVRYGGKGSGDARVMVALKIPGYAARQVAIKGGEKPDELHVTLAYLGRRSTIGRHGLEAIRRLLGKIASKYQNLSGSIGGRVIFPPSKTSDGLVPVCAAVDVPGLSELRQAIVDGLDLIGVPPKSDHGFTPHVCLKYEKPGKLDGAIDVDAEDVHFPEVFLVVGGRWEPFRFSASGERLRYARVHAPHNMTVAGKPFRGGEFIPSGAVAQASPQERLALGLAAPQAVAAPEAPAVADRPYAGAAATEETWTGHHREAMGRFRAAIDAADVPEARKRRYSRAAEFVLKRMPEGMAKSFNEGIREIRFLASMEEVTEAVRKRGVAVREGSVTAGFVDYDLARNDGKGTLYLDGQFPAEKRSRQRATNWGLAGMVDVYAHEMAHVVDPGLSRSRTRDWGRCHDLEHDEGQLSRYSATSPTESWAEFGRLVLTRGPEIAAEHFPMSYACWARHGLVEAAE